MALPQFAPFPNSELRRSLLPQEWGVYLDSWTSLAELYLRANDAQFSSAIAEGASLTSFLISFFHAVSHDNGLQVQTLRRKCFLLVHRIYSGDDVPPALLDWTTLSDICRVFPKSEQFRALLDSLWKRRSTEVEKSLMLAKNSISKQLDSKKPEGAESTLDRIVPLLRVSTDASRYMFTGSDVLDSLCIAYPKVSSPIQTKLTTTAYLGLLSLIEGAKPSFSQLPDHLYSLKSNAELQRKSGQKSLVEDLVTNTPLLHKIRDRATTAEATRVKNFAASLSIFQDLSLSRPKKLVRRKIDKGKGKAGGGQLGHTASGDVHVHRMSLISQIQDLFPDLGSAFITTLLREYDDNVEEVTAHLLEDNLPPHIANADRSEQLPANAEPRPHLSPRTTPPPSERRNVFDNDAFDRLAVDTSRLHIGRKNKQLTADDILSDRNAVTSKSAILSALAAFDSDDDERDDTYDVEDVGGTVDSTMPGADEADAGLREKNEETLFRAYSSTPALFGRDAETRRGNARAALKSETGMTDEAIEGWGLMIGRDPKRLRKLEAMFSAFSGQQAELVSTSWRQSPADSGGEGSADGQRGGRGGRSGRGHGRGRGRGGGGRGGNVAGATEEKSTQVSRQRKEANKGSRANHNRRDQRAKKMARGGLTG